MLKRNLLFIFCLLLFLFLTKTPIYAQDLPTSLSDITFDQAYGEHKSLLEEYEKAHDEYILKRAQFIKFQSLKSRQEAFDATLVMLEKRDEVVVSYLKVLSLKIEEGVGMAEDKEKDVLFRLNEEVEWFAYHKDNLPTTGSLDDLIADSKEAERRSKVIEPLAYEVMSLISQGKIVDYDKRTRKLFGEIKDKLEQIRYDERDGYSFSSTKFQLLDRWIFEAESKIVRNNEKQSEADEIISEMSKRKSINNSDYNKVLSKLGESHLYLKEAVLFFKEIIKQLKTAE